jgi:hypothetical protein
MVDGLARFLLDALMRLVNRRSGGVSRAFHVNPHVPDSQVRLRSVPTEAAL